MPRITPDQVQVPTDELLVGGPDSASPADDAVPTRESVNEDEQKLVKVKINGVEYLVDPEMAAALEEREKDFQRKLSEQAEDLRRRYAQPVQPNIKQPKEEDDNLEVLLFENPKEALSKFENRIIQRVIAAYQADQGEKEFWSAFYREYPDLAKHDRIARAILAENFNQWAHLPTATARRELANAVREEIVSILNAHRENTGGENKPRRRTFVESGSGSRPAPKPESAPAQPRTLSDIIRQRSQARRAAPSTRS